MNRWTDDLLCGVDEIDEQHRQLFELIQNISNCIINSENQKALNEAFAFLEFYVTRHFTIEEHYMSSYHYSGYAEHKAEHIHFMEDFMDLKSFSKNNEPHPNLAVELEGSLYHWLAIHFTSFDREMCKFLKESVK